VDWQSATAIGLAVAGGLWVGWTLVRPFVRPSRPDCGLCPPGTELLGIAPPDEPSPEAAERPRPLAHHESP
jgi:hypothetical protein